MQLTSKDLHNYKAKIKPKGDEAKQLHDELKKIEKDHPNSVKTRVNANNELECIFIQTKFMRNWYIEYHDVHLSLKISIDLQIYAHVRIFVCAHTYVFLE